MQRELSFGVGLNVTCMGERLHLYADSFDIEKPHPETTVQQARQAKLTEPQP